MKRNGYLSVVLGVLLTVVLGLLLYVSSDLRSVKGKQAQNSAPCPVPPVASQPAPSQTTKCLQQQLAVNQTAQQKAIASAQAKADQANATTANTAKILAQISRLLAEVDLHPVSPGLISVVPAAGPGATQTPTGHPTPTTAPSRSVKPSASASPSVPVPTSVKPSPTTPLLCLIGVCL